MFDFSNAELSPRVGFLALGLKAARLTCSRLTAESLRLPDSAVHRSSQVLGESETATIAIATTYEK